jgi:hypothetical protein
LDKLEQSKNGAAPVVDLRALEETLEVEGAKEIAAGFLEDVATVPDRLKNSVQDKNAESLRHASHMLKGCCRIIMAASTAELAGKMELIATEKRWTDAEQLLPELLDSFGTTVDYLQAYLE